MINMRPVANLGEKATTLSTSSGPCSGGCDCARISQLPNCRNCTERFRTSVFLDHVIGGYLFRDPIISLHLYYFTTPRLHHSPFKTRVDVVDAQFIITLFLGPETWVNVCEIPYPFTLSCIIIILRIFAGRKCCVCDQHIHS